MPAMSSSPPLTPVHAGLSDLAQDRRRAHRLVRGLHAAWLWLAGLLIVVLADAVFPIAEGGRKALALALLAALGAVLWRWRLPRPADAHEPHREARCVERWFHLSANPLINALWLAPLADSREPAFPAALAQRTLDRGAAALHKLDPTATIDRRPVRRHAGALLVTAVLWVILLLFLPRLAIGGLLRLGDFWHDRPPFSFTQFTVAITPEEPIEGDDVRVSATLSGHIAEACELAVVNPSGAVTQRWPMAPASPGRFEHTVPALREPITLQVQTAAGRSPRFTITPQPRVPRPSSAVPDTQALPESTGSPDTPDAATPERIALTRLGELADLARRLQALAEALRARLDAAPGQPLPAWMQQELAELLRRLEHFAAQNQALSTLLKQLSEAQGSTGAAQQLLAASLARAAQQLAGTQLPGMPGLAPRPQRGGDPPLGSAAADWLRQVREAAEHDAAALEGELARLGAAMGGTTAGGGATQPALPVGPPGTGNLAAPNPGGANPDRSAAWVQQVPPAYRELAGRYFERITRDQGK